MFKSFLFSLIILGGYGVDAQIQPESKTKKVVFIIVDGIAEDMLQHAEIPNLKRISHEGAFLPAYVGGEKGEYSETPTISAVGYNSLLTGTWVNKHNVFDNFKQFPNYHYPTIFKIFKDNFPQKKTAIYSTWIDNRKVLLGEGLADTGNFKTDIHFDGLDQDKLDFPDDNQDNNYKFIDYFVGQNAAQGIRNLAPDLTWVYLQHTDDVAHKYGDSEILNRNIKFEDQLIGEIFDAVKDREKKYSEDWLFIVTTDHGRTADGKGHGGQTDRERQTWMVTNKPEINAYAKTNRVAIVDIYPTIANFLNLKIPTEQEWELDGVDLYHGSPAFNLKAKANSDSKISLTWNVSKGTTGPAEIYYSTTNNFKKGGKDTYYKLGKVAVQNQSFSKKMDLKKSDFYKFVLLFNGKACNTWWVRSAK